MVNLVFKTTQYINVHPKYQIQILEQRKRYSIGQSTNFLYFIAYTQMPIRTTYADVSSNARGINFGQSFHLHSFVCMRVAKAKASLRLCADSS